MRSDTLNRLSRDRKITHVLLGDQQWHEAANISRPDRETVAFETTDGTNSIVVVNDVDILGVKIEKLDL